MISTFESLFSGSPPALFAVFWIGALASLSSCMIVRLPVVVGYVGSSGTSKGRALGLTALFTLGLILVYVVLGAITAFAGGAIHQIVRFNKYIYWLLGGVLLVTGLLVSGLVGVHLLPKGCRFIATGLANPSYPGALLFGALFGMLMMPACPCCGAGLLVLAGVVVARHMVWSQAVAIFASFALGQSLPVLALGILTSLLTPDLVRKIRTRMCSIEQRIQLIAGNVLIVLGIYFIVIG